MTDTKELDKKLTKARINLLANYPFFGSLAFGLETEWDDSLNPPTTSTNGKRIRFHPDFFSELSDHEAVFVLAHEVMHPALLHHLRKEDREDKKWDAACDIVVNYFLHESNVGVMPEGGLHRPDIYETAKGKAETIYDMIELKDCPKNTGHIESGNGEGEGEGEGEGSMSKAEADAQAADWKNKLHQAMQQAKAIGNMPGSLEAFIKELTENKVSWQDQLREFVTTTRGTDRCWSRRNRRHIATGLMVPGTVGEQLGEIVFAIDCSGSTSDEMVSQCGAELRSIQEDFRPEKIHVIYWDTKVQKHEEFEADDPVQAKVYGRGGTDVRCVWKFIEEQGIEPEKVIVATDLYLGGPEQFGRQPDYPVLWTVMESSQRSAPWGEVLVVD